MKNVLVIAVYIVVIVLAVLNLTYDPTPKPDAVYPMTNQHIEWTYAGK